MRVEIHDGVLTFVVSERNLISMLSKLYTPGSARTIESVDVPANFKGMRLCAEEDTVHYASPTRMGAPAGPMHPTTERIVQTIKQIVAEENLRF